ncbi:hypothetical protein D3C78_1947470 [compost metagenome]
MELPDFLGLPPHRLHQALKRCSQQDAPPMSLQQMNNLKLGNMGVLIVLFSRTANIAKGAHCLILIVEA